MLSCWARILIGLTMMLQATNGQTGITPDPSGPPEVTIGSSITASTNVSSNTSAAPSLVTTSTTSFPPLTTSPSPTNASADGSLNTTAAPSLGITPDPSGPPEVTSGSSIPASTNVSSNASAAPSLVTTSTTSSTPLTIGPNQTNASTNGSNTTAAPSLVTNSTTSFSRLTISPSQTNTSTNGSLITTAAPSLVTNSTIITGLTNITAIAGIQFSCASDPPLCCMGLDSSCFRGCYCDVACLRLRDCCSDFNATCITGFPTSQPNLTNTTSTNETTFPIFSFSGSCSANSSMCCSGNNPSCFNGCFCDESCASQTIPDCCPDYNDTCMKATNGTNTTLTTVSPEAVTTTPTDPQKLIFALSVSFLAPASYSNSTIQTAVEQALSTIRALLIETTGSDLSYKVLKIKIK